MNEFYKAMRFMTVMAGSCVAAVCCGIWLDRQFNSTPWMLLTLLFYAIGANLYRLMKGGEKDE